MGKLFARVGSAAMLAGASLFVIGGQAHASNTPAVHPSVVTCPNNDLAHSHNKLLAYEYLVDLSATCTLDGNVSPNSTVTAFFIAPEETNPEITLASYTVPGGDPTKLNDQKLFQCATTGSDSNCTGGTSGVTNGVSWLKVQVPNCKAFQIDFVVGPVITKYDTTTTPPTTYHGQNRWIDGDTGTGPANCGATPTPTPPTPTPPTSTPSGGVGGASTTPTPAATGSVQGISTPSTGASAGSNLGTDALAFALLFFGFVMVGLARRRPLELS